MNQGGAWGEGSRRGAVSTEALRLGCVWGERGQRSQGLGLGLWWATAGA